MRFFFDAFEKKINLFIVINFNDKKKNFFFFIPQEKKRNVFLGKQKKLIKK